MTKLAAQKIGVQMANTGKSKENNQMCQAQVKTATKALNEIVQICHKVFGKDNAGDVIGIIMKLAEDARKKIRRLEGDK